MEALWFIFAYFWPLKMPSIHASILRQIWIAIYRWKALNVSFPTQLEAHQLDICSSSYSPLKEAWSCCERPDFTLAKILASNLTLHHDSALPLARAGQCVLIAYSPLIWSWATLLKAWPKAPKCAPTSKCVPKLFFSPFFCASLLFFSFYFLQDL